MMWPEVRETSRLAVFFCVLREKRVHVGLPGVCVPNLPRSTNPNLPLLTNRTLESVSVCSVPPW
jgi:hypothetical protein